MLYFNEVGLILEGTLNFECNFECDQGAYAAVQKCTLTRHINNVHIKVRNFKCEQCGHAFVQKYNLDAHFKAKHYKQLK